MPVAVLVGKAALDQPSDQGLAKLGLDHLLDAGTIQAARRQLALHQADDVAPLAHLAERGLKTFGKPVAPPADVLC